MFVWIPAMLLCQRWFTLNVSYETVVVLNRKRVLFTWETKLKLRIFMNRVDWITISVVYFEARKLVGEFIIATIFSFNSSQTQHNISARELYNNVPNLMKINFNYV